MNPEIAQMLATMQAEINQLKSQLAQLQSVAGLDPQIVRTIGELLLASSSKTVASETLTQSVNEAGVATYDITYLNVPDRFITIGSVNVPAYDS